MALYRIKDIVSGKTDNLEMDDTGNGKAPLPELAGKTITVTAVPPISWDLQNIAEHFAFLKRTVEESAVFPEQDSGMVFSSSKKAAKAWGIHARTLQKWGKKGRVRRSSDPERKGGYLYAMPMSHEGSLQQTLPLETQKNEVVEMTTTSSNMMSVGLLNTISETFRNVAETANSLGVGDEVKRALGQHFLRMITQDFPLSAPAPVTMESTTPTPDQKMAANTAEFTMRRDTHVTLRDRMESLGYNLKPGYLSMLGKVVANTYRKQFKAEPPKQEVFYRNRTIEVFTYPLSFATKIDYLAKSFVASTPAALEVSA